MGLNREVMRFDKRLVRRNLREGRITLEELNQHLDALEDVAHLAAPEEDGSAVDEDDIDDEEDEDEEGDDE